MVSRVPTGFEGSKVRNRLILLGGGLKNGLILAFFCLQNKNASQTKRENLHKYRNSLPYLVFSIQSAILNYSYQSDPSLHPCSDHE